MATLASNLAPTQTGPNGSRQVVPHHDFNPNLFLLGENGLAPRERQKHADRRTRLVTWVLHDDRIQGAPQKAAPGERRQIVSNEHHIRFPA